MKKREINKIILDTSFQLERLKVPDFDKYLDRLITNGNRVFGLYYSFYELKTGFTRSIIDFFNLIKLTGDTSSALIIVSDHRGRDPKNILILEGIQARVYPSISPEC